jgi:hypothetical protein
VSVCLQAQTLRKKASRVEDDNESLVLQLKKMATKARSMLVMKEKEISLQHFSTEFRILQRKEMADSFILNLTSSLIVLAFNTLHNKCSSLSVDIHILCNKGVRGKTDDLHS